MTTKRTISQLNTLLKVYKSQEDNAARELKQALSGLIEAKKTYEQLSQYALQYHHQLIDMSTEKAQSGLSWQQYTQFLASLDHSKHKQVHKIAEDERLVQGKRRMWLALHQNRSKIEFLLKKQEDKLNERLTKAEQRELDDLINQYHIRSYD